MKKSILKTVLLTALLTLSWSWSFAQELTTPEPGTQYAVPWHTVYLTVTVPNNIPVGTKVTVNAAWHKKYETLTPPTNKKEFTVISGQTSYVLEFICVTDAWAIAVDFCGWMMYYQGSTLKILYASNDVLIDQSHSYTACSIGPWSTSASGGCPMFDFPGGNNLD